MGHLRAGVRCFLGTLDRSVPISWYLLVCYLRLRRPHALHGRIGHLFALWAVSPHSSHIALSVRGPSFRLWPFGSSVPWQLVQLCSGHAKLKALLWVVLPHPV